MTEPRRGFPVGMTIAVAVAFAILAALGTWQLQRLAWKEQVLARIAALKASPARPVEDALRRLAAGEDVDFMRVKTVCPGLATAPFLELYTVRDGEVGSRLISACRIGDARYGSILTDRGFVPDTVPARPPVATGDATPIEVTGVLRRPEHGNLFSPANTPALWYVRDVAAMGRALGAARPAPLFLMAETGSGPGVAPAPIPTEIPNRHLEYALTWYGLAAALLGVYAAVLWKRRTG